MEANRHIAEVRTASGFNIVAGLWELLAPFVLIYATGAAVMNDIVVGLAVAVFAAIRFFMPGRSTAWLSWVNVALGIWLVLSPFVLGYTTAFAMWNDIIMGIIIAGLALWSTRKL